MHFAAAVRAFDGDSVDEGTVQLDILGAVVRHLTQLGDGADGMAVSAFAFPNVERRAPVAVAGDAPVLHVFKPVAEASLADGFRNPVDRVVVLDEVLAHLGHFDEP